MKQRTIFLKLTISLIAFFSITLSYAQINYPTSLEVITLKAPFACEGDSFNLFTPKVIEKGIYTWYRNDQLIEFGTNSTFTATQAGTYKVVCSNDSLTFTSNSIEIFPCNINPKDANNGNSISLSTPSITSSDNVICGSYTEAHLTCSIQNNSYTYKWYYSTSYSGSYSLISGATSYNYTATQAGYYQVFVDDGATTPATSYPFQVYSSPFVKLTDANNNQYTTINTTAGANVSLKVNFIGTSLPVTFGVKNGVNTLFFTATTNPFTFTVKTNQNSRVFVNNLYSDCGNGTFNSSGQNYLVVNSATDFTFVNGSNQNVCAGQTLDIPYTTTGTWSGGRNFGISLYDQNNNYVKGWYDQTTSPLKIDLPSNLTLNSQYKVTVSLNTPYISNNSKSFYITPTSNGCTASAFLSLFPGNQACGAVQLFAQPYTYPSTYLYKFYKNDVAILESTSPYYTATSSGNYKVKVTNPATGSNSTSPNYAVTTDFAKPVMSSSSQSVCNSPNGVTLTSQYTGSGYTYQWYYQPPNGGGTKPILNATSSTYTAFTEGYYAVYVSDGLCTAQSDYYYMSGTSYIKATNTGDENNYTTISAGSSATIKLTLSGIAPYTISYYENYGSTKTIITNSNTYNLSVSPNYSTIYVFNVKSNCGSSYSASFTVNVNANTAFSLTSPSNTTVCSSNFFNIPYTTSGTWPSERKFNVSLTDLNGNSISNSNQYDILTSNNTIPYYINSFIANGTYKVKVYSYKAYISTPQISTYTITVNNTGCTIPNASLRTSSTDPCSFPTLSAYPFNYSYSYTYKWYKDGTLVSTTNNWNYYPSSSGTYYVVITDGNGYNSTSNSINVSITFSNFTSHYNSCSSGAALIPSNNQSGNTYHWYYSTGDLAYADLNSTASTYTSGNSGNYLVIIKNGNCETRERFNCAFYLQTTTQTICSGSEINITYNNSYSNSSTFKFQLLNASTNAVVVDNLYASTLYYGTNTFSVSLPLSVPVGTYKIKAFFIENPLLTNTSDAIITVTSATTPSPLTISATPSSISSSENVSVAASSCYGNYQWNYNNYTSQNFSAYLNNGYEFKVSCKDLSGCSSPTASFIVPFTCTDAYEPNDNSGTASVIHGDAFTSTPICLGYNTDQDWFSFITNGRKYYAMVRHYYANNTNTPIQFYFKKELVGDELTLQTYPVNTGVYHDTYLFLFDENMNIIAYNDNSNGNGFSKIIYNITNNCQSNVEFLTSEYDIYPNETSTVKSSNYIKAKTKIMDTSKASFEAQNYILLDAGFETNISTGGFFKAEIKTCN